MEIPADPRPSLATLFPGLDEARLKQVDETMYAYCATIWRIYERLERERPEIIDELMRNRRMKTKVDSSKEKP